MGAGSGIGIDGWGESHSEENAQQRSCNQNASTYAGSSLRERNEIEKGCSPAEEMRVGFTLKANLRLGGEACRGS
jgi:hypothetical protein